MVINHLLNGMILQAQEDLDDDLEKYFGRSSGEVGEGGMDWNLWLWSTRIC